MFCSEVKAYRYSLVKRSFVNGILYKIFLSCDLLCAKWRPNTNIYIRVITDVFCNDTAEKIYTTLTQNSKWEESNCFYLFYFSLSYWEKSIMTSAQGNNTQYT